MGNTSARADSQRANNNPERREFDEVNYSPLKTKGKGQSCRDVHIHSYQIRSTGEYTNGGYLLTGYSYKQRWFKTILRMLIELSKND